MRPLSALAAVAAASLLAAAPAGAATWSPPATVSAPHTFVSPLEAASSGNGTVVLHWGFQDGIGAGASTGVRGASLLPGAAAFGPERTLPGDTLKVAPYARRSIAALLTPRDRAGGIIRLAVAFGSVDGPSVGAPRTVATDDVAFVPSFAVASDGTGLLAWISRASGNRRVVKVSLRAPGGRFGAPSIIAGTGRANSIVAAVGPQGQRVVAFERSGHLFTRFRAAGHNWGSIQDLGAVAAGTDNELAALIANGGRATIVDLHRQLTEGGDTGPLLVDAWVRPVGASRFGARQRLEDGGQIESSRPELVEIEGRGAVLAWLGADPSSQSSPLGPGRRVNVSLMGASGRFGPAQALSASDEAAVAVNAAGSGGNVIVSWVRPTAGSDTSGQVMAALRLAGAGFTPAEVVSPVENASLTAPGFSGSPGSVPFVAWASRPGGEGPGVPIGQIRTFVRVAQRTP